MAAVSAVSPDSTLPPGNSHRPAKGTPGGRCPIRKRPSCSTTAIAIKVGIVQSTHHAPRDEIIVALQMAPIVDGVWFHHAERDEYFRHFSASSFRFFAAARISSLACCSRSGQTNLGDLLGS